MKFKVGQKWETRDGRVAEIKSTTRDSAEYPIVVTIGDDPFEWTYCEEGTPYKRQGEPLDRDLVRLTEDVPDEEGWIEWNGGENPAPGATVEYRMRGGDSYEDEANNLRWNACGWAGDIVAYRVVKGAEPTPKPEPFTITEPGEYVTRNGRKAVVTALGLRSTYPVSGYICSPDWDSVSTWLPDGSYRCGGTDQPSDIVGRWSPWAHLAIDTPVWVKDKLDAEWVPRHFAGVRYGTPTCWNDGYTSHTTTDITAWEELSLTAPE